jgi:hypothetical protein
VPGVEVSVTWAGDTIHIVGLRIDFRDPALLAGLERTRMGRDGDPMAVLDAQCRLRGVRGLRVADAGAMPSITSGNTNSPTLMLAEKAAEWIIADAR